jgi:hypothetical protein
MLKAKITKRAVEAISATSSDVILWDTELKGFGLKVTPKGKRSYFVYYRSDGGTQRRPSIGEHGQITAEQARDIARQWLAKVATGDDPSQNRQSMRAAPTLSEVRDRFLKSHVDHRNKESTARDYKRMIEQHIKPSLGSHKIHEISRLEITSATLDYSRRVRIP